MTVLTCDRTGCYEFTLNSPKSGTSRSKTRVFPPYPWMLISRPTMVGWFALRKPRPTTSGCQRGFAVSMANRGKYAGERTLTGIGHISGMFWVMFQVPCPTPDGRTAEDLYQKRVNWITPAMRASARSHGCRFHRAWFAADGSAFYAIALWESREGANAFFRE